MTVFLYSRLPGAAWESLSSNCSFSECVCGVVSFCNLLLQFSVVFSAFIAVFICNRTSQDCRSCYQFKQWDIAFVVSCYCVANFKDDHLTPKKQNGFSFYFYELILGYKIQVTALFPPIHTVTIELLENLHWIFEFAKLMH